tara:strand:+ start:404 stop:643 length:240 start_codon:yes stop_codon:yes gene_type:complete
MTRKEENRERSHLTDAGASISETTGLKLAEDTRDEKKTDGVEGITVAVLLNKPNDCRHLPLSADKMPYVDKRDACRCAE